MMEDRELLELAAKAAGYKIKNVIVNASDEFIGFRTSARSLTSPWNPLTDDGDALRLAIRMRIDIEFDLAESGDECVYTHPIVGHGERRRVAEPLDTHHAASTRLAIVRAAAAMVSEQSAAQPEHQD